MELSHQGGAEGESLLRGERGGVVVPHRSQGWEGEGEKAPFLRNEPVKLTPAWEGSNLPNDTLNLKGITMNEAPPKDKWNLIYITLILHGVGTLTAFNMFITAKDYFEKYKLKDTQYSATFMVYIGYASQLPNFLFSWFNVFVPIGGPLTVRIIISLAMEVVIFVVTIILAMLDSSEWTGSFFWLTMVTVFILNVFNAVFQNSVYGVAANLPPRYTGAVILGSNVCGTIVVLLNWATSSVGNLRTAAIYFFIGGMFVILACLDTYFALPLNRFYRYHDKKQSKSTGGGSAATGKTPYGAIIRQCWVQMFNVWAVFFVSLGTFPAITSDIHSVSDPPLFGDNFMRITCFLTFNFMAMIGSITANIFPYPSRNWLSIFVIARFVFIPMFLLCNYKPAGVTRTMVVAIQSDWLYWITGIIMGWSSGHFSSLGMMYISSIASPEYASKAGMIGGAMMITGILSGIALSGFGRTLVSLELWNNM